MPFVPLLLPHLLLFVPRLLPHLQPSLPQFLPHLQPFVHLLLSDMQPLVPHLRHFVPQLLMNFIDPAMFVFKRLFTVWPGSI